MLRDEYGKMLPGVILVEQTEFQLALFAEIVVWAFVAVFVEQFVHFLVAPFNLQVRAPYRPVFQEPETVLPARLLNKGIR
ncbi:MAG: hypothetical protein G8D61_08005 [gamma proteobacterium symbiont of Ctena orbiculata]